MERGLYTTSEIWKVTLYYYSTSLKAIPPTGIDVTVPWSVCLSVCLSRSCIVLKRQKISTRFLTIGQDMKVETNTVFTVLYSYTICCVYVYVYLCKNLY